MLVGTVVDDSGALIVGANLRIRHIETNEVREVKSDPQGEFTAPNLAPGRYDVTVTHEGFRTLHEAGIELEIEQAARMQFRLQLGEMSQSIEVMATAPLLNTENSVKGQVMVSAEIGEMPLNGRDFSDLAFLTPGVSPTAQGGSGSAFSINGARSDNTNFLIDGFNDQNPRGAAAQARPNLDALQEFKMQTTGYPAEYGRLAGGVMNMVLKSGSNRFHGVLFEFLRNDVFDARNFFDAGKSRLHRNQFGGTVGGPVSIPGIYKGRDRTFFLFSWESFRQSQGLNRLGIIPTAAEQSGDFSADSPLKDPVLKGLCTATTRVACFPENVIPRSRLSPIALRAAAFYPLPNLPGQVNNYRSHVNAPNDWDSFVMKFDHRLSAKDNLTWFYTKRYNRSSDPFNGSNYGIFGDVVRNHQSLMGLTSTRMFSPSLISEARAGFSRTTEIDTGVNQGHDYAADFGIPGVTNDPKLTGFPRITILNLMTLGDGANMPVAFFVTNIQASDTLTMVKSRHVIKFGGDVLRTRFNQPYYNNNRGTFNFLGRWTSAPFADFLLGLPETTSRQAGVTPNYPYSTSYSLFAQDDWKANGALTLNFGLRYEVLKPPEDKYGRWTNFIPEYGKLVLADDATIRGTGVAFSDPSKVATAAQLGLPSPLTYTNWANIAPRFGFAWRPWPGNRAVIRGGYGIFYGTSLQNQVRLDLSDVFPFSLNQTFNRNASNPAFLTLANPFPSPPNLTGNVVNVNGFELHAKTPYVQSWNLTLEREIGFQSAIEIAYAGSKGTHLGWKYDLNQPFRGVGLALPDGSFPRPYAGVNTINYYGFNANSTYHSGAVTLKRRSSRGLFYNASYVFSKSIDNASQLTGAGDGGYAGAQNSRNRGGERGRSDFDIGHSFTTGFSYLVPLKGLVAGGWQFSGTARMYTGQPFTPQVSNVNLNLGEANRPNRIAKGAVDNPTADRWFEVSAFPPVPTGSFQFGNSGRNILDGPGHEEVNLTAFKNFQLAEGRLVQFRWEVFNVLNHANLRLPDDHVNAPSAATITGAGAAREMQFGLRFVF